ncbi:acyl carrier protein-like protein [Umbelopsis sp. PMI_123]|nr:acyl carrier protein-like protein [Umbelopsis sp. PMI_123]
MLRTSAFSAIFKTASRVAAYQVAQPVARLSPVAVGRFYSAGAGLDRSDIESRILDILKGFDKIDPTKVSLNATFTNDLGLDSLDAVEVVMAIEEEFSVEIPDKEADEIKTAAQAVEYISQRSDAH